jgi:hypothetical protein
MKKKTYIQPCIATYLIQLTPMLSGSSTEDTTPNEYEFDYTGDGHGEAGPDEIDDTQTYDHF